MEGLKAERLGHQGVMYSLRRRRAMQSVQKISALSAVPFLLTLFFKMLFWGMPVLHCIFNCQISTMAKKAHSIMDILSSLGPLYEV